MRIYISHSVGCAGWNMEDIFEGTLFQTGCRTMRFKEQDIGKVKMLDLDYLEWQKDPEKVEHKHLQLTLKHRFDVVMSMDVWIDNIPYALNFANKLLKWLKMC